MGQAVQLLNDSTSPLSPAPVLLESAALCAALRRCVHHMLAQGKGAAAALVVRSRGWCLQISIYFQWLVAPNLCRRGRGTSDSNWGKRFEM